MSVLSCDGVWYHRHMNSFQQRCGSCVVSSFWSATEWHLQQQYIQVAALLLSSIYPSSISVASNGKAYMKYTQNCLHAINVWLFDFDAFARHVNVFITNYNISHDLFVSLWKVFLDCNCFVLFIRELFSGIIYLTPPDIKLMTLSLPSEVSG